MQDPNPDLIDTVIKADKETAPVSGKEKKLLAYAEKLTLEPAKMTAADSDVLREVGWTDNQIAEAVYIISLFAFFNRVADAFGLCDPEYRKHDPLPEAKS